MDYQTLLDRITAGYDSSSNSSDKEAYRTALDCEVLLLDDLGAHRVTGLGAGHRHEHRHPSLQQSQAADCHHESARR